MLYDLLTNAAAKYPQRIAIEDKDGAITYRQLWDDSRALGAILEHRFKGQTHIGVLMEKSADCLLSIYGILAAHMAYVPLDEGLPPERLRYILTDAGIDCLITDRQHYDLAIKLWDAAGILVLDEQQLRLAEAHRSDPAKGRHEDLAYILYTSGSTGFPKGIMHTHGSALAFVNWAVTYFGVNEKDVFSSHAPFHFDLSIFDIYVSIAVGAKLCLLPKAISSFPASLASYIREKKLTVWYSVPYILVSLFSEKNLKNCGFDKLRIVIYAGEAMMPGDAARIQERLPQTAIYNLYGPTETNVITYYQLTAKTYQRGDRQIPIGSPCPYADIRVLDADGNEVGAGESGELVVKSDSFMKGYVNKGTPAKGEYPTGDIVKKDAGNQLVFIGRKDQMVKVNGFRVELGDIEHHVKCFNGITDCYARLTSTNNRDQIEVMLEAPELIPVPELKGFMAARLPGYMLPANYVCCHQLERNSRGKLIRK